MGNISTEKVKYAILKRFEKAMDEDEPSPNFKKDVGHEVFGISEKKWTYIILDMKEEGLIEGIEIIEDGYRDYDIVHINRARITVRGREYLKENSLLVKSYGIVKELRDWIKTT